MTIQIPVLDHGYVRLVDYMGSDLSIVRAARVSYNADWRAGDDTGSDSRLIRYLIKNGHTSPFEHVIFTFEVKAPIFVFRQWHRHRTWSFNEVSARYSELPEEFYTPRPEDIGVQSKNNKQARDLGADLSDEDYNQLLSEVAYYEKDCRRAFASYRWLLERGWPRELARCTLPLSTYSKMFATIDLHNLFHFLELRLHEHSQFEIRDYAEAILELVDDAVPVAIDAWRENRVKA